MTQMNEQEQGPPAGGKLAVAHHHPGRLRIRSWAFEGPSALGTATEQWLSEQLGVLAVHSHASTGSLLVLYDPSRIDAGDLLTAIVDRTQLAIVTTEPLRLKAQAIFDSARAIDERVLEWSGGRVDLRFAMPMALGAGSIASLLLSAHARTPRWDNLLYWGVQFLRTLNRDRGGTHARTAG